jgi:hypothetical protein
MLTDKVYATGSAADQGLAVIFLSKKLRKFGRVHQVNNTAGSQRLVKCRTQLRCADRCISFTREIK